MSARPDSIRACKLVPLPVDSAFWTHPKVLLTPHNAADTDPDAISKYVAAQIERYEAGQALENVVDLARGYSSSS